VIEMRNITIRYGRRTLLDGLSWRVCAGERWLLTGPNGSGKTTILSLVTGDNPASYAHDVKVLGQPRRTGESIWRVRRRIGEVSPEIQAYFDQTATSLETALSGRRNADGAIMRATPAARAEARRWLGHFGVKQFADAPFGALSAGSQRLVLLARAMLPRPELLLLDEPCLNLEGSAHRLVLRTVERLMRSQPDLALVCVAHRAQDIPNGITHHLALT
jgi:molybdate transport system ATP-binding protein